MRELHDKPQACTKRHRLWRLSRLALHGMPHMCGHLLARALATGFASLSAETCSFPSCSLLLRKLPKGGASLIRLTLDVARPLHWLMSRGEISFGRLRGVRSGLPQRRAQRCPLRRMVPLPRQVLAVESPSGAEETDQQAAVSCEYRRVPDLGASPTLLR